jgi:hypothetical protein
MEFCTCAPFRHVLSVEDLTDGGRHQRYDDRMPPLPQLTVAARLLRIRGIADDLSRELFRGQSNPAGPVHLWVELLDVIKAEADTALAELRRFEHPHRH